MTRKLPAVTKPDDPLPFSPPLADDVRIPDFKAALFTAFQADHALLGRGLAELRGYLLDDEPERLRQTARGLLRTAGAHIAFEEHDFYPALRARLSDAEVGTMYREHAEGRDMLARIADATDEELRDASNSDELLIGIEALERHVAGCGDLFGAMGGLSEQEACQLLRKLKAWRKQAPVRSGTGDKDRAA